MKWFWASVVLGSFIFTLLSDDMAETREWFTINLIAVLGLTRE